VSLLPLGTAARAQVVAEALLEPQPTDFVVTARSDDDWARLWGDALLIRRRADFDASDARAARQLVLLRLVILFVVDQQRSISRSICVRGKRVGIVAVREVTGAHHHVHHRDYFGYEIRETVVTKRSVRKIGS